MRRGRRRNLAKCDSITRRMGVGLYPQDGMGIAAFDAIGAPAALAGGHGPAAGNPGALASLSYYEKGMLMAALGKGGECGIEEVAQFRAMHPGVRELRLRNIISRIWTNGRWRNLLAEQVNDGKRSALERAELIARELHAARLAHGALIKACKLSLPTPEEGICAMMQPGELSKNQLAFFTSIPYAASNGLGEREVGDFRRWAINAPGAQIRELWRFCGPNYLSMASLIHKIRFTKEQLTPDEELHLRMTAQEDGIDARKRLEKILGEGLTPAVPEAISGRQEGLLHDARASAEFCTMLDILGVPREGISAAIDRSIGFSKGCLKKDGNHKGNDDSFTSIQMFSSEKGGITLDAVFDGVSGHHGGSVASGIARDTFEIAALAGWISSPEDVRRALVLADISIHAEKKRYGLPRMGTTAAVSYIEGKNFYGIHCGDSDWKIIRDGRVIHSSNPHGAGNIIWSSLGISMRSLDINNQNHLPEPIIMLPDDVALTCSDGIGDVVCDHEYGGAIARKAVPDAIASIVALADSRKDSETKYMLPCGCGEISGKDDDITLTLRYFQP